MVLNILTFVICYLIAAISPSILIGNKVLKKDIRTMGSGNAGTTNAVRTMGKAWGALVFILDLLKVVLSYYIMLGIYKIFRADFNSTAKSIYMLASVIGHSYPIYYAFKGGKGVAVFLMACLLVDTSSALVCITVGVIVILIFKMVSLGSIVGSILLLILALFMDTNFNFIVLLLTVALVIFNHRENIKRIFNGTENKLF